MSVVDRSIDPISLQLFTSGLHRFLAMSNMSESYMEVSAISHTVSVSIDLLLQILVGQLYGFWYTSLTSRLTFQSAEPFKTSFARYNTLLMYNSQSSQNPQRRHLGFPARSLNCTLSVFGSVKSALRPIWLAILHMPVDTTLFVR